MARARKTVGTLTRVGEQLVIPCPGEGVQNLEVFVSLPWGAITLGRRVGSKVELIYNDQDPECDLILSLRVVPDEIPDCFCQEIEV